MSAATYRDFQWRGAGAANGESGVGLTNAFLKVVSKLANVERVCDLGCGNGYMTGALAKLGYDVVGIDASETGIKIAREVHPQARFIQSLIDEELGRTPDLGKFDLVLSSDVIEHLYRPSDLIETAKSLLHPDGQILIGTPYHGYLKPCAKPER